MPDPTLCFAAGSPKRPNSGVWRLWTHGPDTYLAARVAAHLFKLSMHKSGQWISAFTSQSGVVVGKETGSRRQGHVDPSSIHQKQGARNGAVAGAGHSWRVIRDGGWRRCPAPPWRTGQGAGRCARTGRRWRWRRAEGRTGSWSGSSAAASAASAPRCRCCRPALMSRCTSRRRCWARSGPASTSAPTPHGCCIGSGWLVSWPGPAWSRRPGISGAGTTAAPCCGRRWPDG